MGVQKEVSKDEAIEAGIELLAGRIDPVGGGNLASEAYQDLCLTLNVDQIKQLNTLIGLLTEAGG